MNIELITIEENNLLNHIHQYKGDMNLIVEKMNKDKIFISYSNIHKSYVELSEKGNNLESLKRAIFIQWYSISEPSGFTGIGDLCETSQKKAITILDKLLLENRIDEEFILMLAHYENVNGLIDFNMFNASKILNNHLENLLKLDLNNQYSKIAVENRGQLGNYWNSIINQKMV